MYESNYAGELALVIQVIILFFQTIILGFHGYMFYKQKKEAEASRKSQNFFNLMTYLEKQDFKEKTCEMINEFISVDINNTNIELLRELLKLSEMSLDMYIKGLIDKRMFEKLYLDGILCICNRFIEEDKDKSKEHIENKKRFYPSLYKFWREDGLRKFKEYCSFHSDTKGVPL